MRPIIAALIVALALLPAQLSAQIFRGRVFGTQSYQPCGNPLCEMCYGKEAVDAYRSRMTASTHKTLESRASRAQALTPLPVVDQMVRLAGLTEDDLVYDPGCGDGRIIESAVRLTGCRALGIEIDAGIAARAMARLRTVLPSRWRVHTGDARRLDLSQATVAIMYMYPDDMRAIVPRLRNARRIISYQHPVSGMANRRVDTPDGPIFIANRPSSPPSWSGLELRQPKDSSAVTEPTDWSGLPEEPSRRDDPWSGLPLSSQEPSPKPQQKLISQPQPKPAMEFFPTGPAVRSPTNAKLLCKGGT